MANSSFTGSVAGYASGTQPGLVSTVAQTFAGDKTLTGVTTASGGIINTGLTGTNATTVTTSGSGKVGEVITATLAGINQASPVNGTYYDDSGTLTLTSGVWSVILTATVYGDGASGISGIQVPALRTAIRSGASTVLTLGLGPTGSVNGVSVVGTITLQKVVVSTGAVLKASISYVPNSGTAAFSTIGLAASYGSFYAVRIA